MPVAVVKALVDCENIPKALDPLPVAFAKAPKALELVPVAVENCPTAVEFPPVAVALLGH
jgi:hypothetical protein